MKKFWDGIKPDLELSIAVGMQMEGYTDFEIDQYILAYRKSKKDEDEVSSNNERP